MSSSLFDELMQLIALLLRLPGHRHEPDGNGPTLDDAVPGFLDDHHILDNLAHRDNHVPTRGGLIHEGLSPGRFMSECSLIRKRPSCDMKSALRKRIWRPSILYG